MSGVTVIAKGTVVVRQEKVRVIEVHSPGPQGAGGTVAVGAVTTGAPGSEATVQNVGTPKAAILNFSIPRGDRGFEGLAATITVGAVVTGAPGSAVVFSNVGTANAAIFNISIPRGDTGEKGSNAWGDITGKPTTIGGYGITDAYANPMTAAGDLTVGGVLGVPARLAIGANGYFLKVVAGAVSWSDFVADVRAATLTGLSLAAGTAITAADTVLSALGKLQKQITDILTVTYATGDMVDTFATTARAGFIFASGRTIGNAASGATERAHADTEALFTLFWNSMTNTEAAVSAGRGASAAADFAANKTIAVPDLRGRVTAGKDNMGGTTANRLTTAGSGIAGTTLGTVGGAETVTLTTTQIPSHSHPLPDEPYLNGTVPGGGSDLNSYGSIGKTSGSTGGGLAHNNTQPTLVVNKIIKL